ncbi:MAG: ROK family protein [Planctomycetia bacterium]|nr:ROK family protein [Planctomycetia bacterium]
MYYIGVDVGGQTIKTGVVDYKGQPVEDISIVPTKSELGADVFLSQVELSIHQSIEKATVSINDIKAIGVATPGLMDIPKGIMTHPVNMPTLRNIPVRDHIQKKLGKPTAFQNDANAAAYGEFWAGAGQGSSSLVLFTLGTGIGCGIIWDKKIIEGEHSHGSEVGHIVIQAFGGRMCGCGNTGHLEAYASETALRKIMTEEIQATPPTMLSQLVQSEGLNARTLFRAAEMNDALAKKIVDDAAYSLAVGATCMMHTIDPDIVLFGGGMSVAAGPKFLEQIREQILRIAFPVPAQNTRIEYASLAEKAGYIGAAGWAKHLFG